MGVSTRHGGYRHACQGSNGRRHEDVDAVSVAKPPKVPPGGQARWRKATVGVRGEAGAAGSRGPRRAAAAASGAGQATPRCAALRCAHHPQL